MGNGCTTSKNDEGVKATQNSVNSNNNINGVWSRNQYEVHKFINLKAHVFSIVSLNQNKIATGTIDNSIRIWDIENCKLLNTLSGHPGSVLCLTLFSPNILLSGSTKETIKVWDLSKLVCIKTLTSGEVFYINSIIKISDSYIASGSNDKDVKIWNMNDENGKVIKTLSGHKFAIFSLLKLEYTPEYFISTSADYTMILWDTKNLVSKDSVTFRHDDRVNCLVELSLNTFISGSDDKSIKVWNLQTKKCISLLIGHNSHVTCLVKLSDNIIASGSRDTKIIIWNVNAGAMIKQLSLHNKPLRNLVLITDNKLASYAFDLRLNIINV